MSFFSLFTRRPYYQGPETHNFNGSQFFDPRNRATKNDIWAFLKMRLREKAGKWPKSASSYSYDKPPTRVNDDKLRVSNVGHVTFLLQTHGLNILTDPVWSERASPFAKLGPRRISPPGIRFEDLPPIDLILISHNHYDHLDMKTLGKLWHKDRPQIITPLGNDTIIQKRYPNIPVETLNWHQTTTVTASNNNVEVHLEPAQHWSARGLFDYNKALWGSFTIKTPSGNIYFVGDAGYGDGSYFRDALGKHKQFRLALLPMGAYMPIWFMKYAHMSPEDMVQAHLDLGQPFTIPSHYDVFASLALEGYGDALQKLELIRNTNEDIAAKIQPLTVGEARWIA